MIILNINGQRTVITGWRAWAIIAPTAVLVALILVVAGILVLGAALSVATVLLFAVPLALVVALGAQLLSPWTSRGRL